MIEPFMVPIVRKIMFFEKLTGFSSRPCSGLLSSNRLFRQPVMLGGHHRLSKLFWPVLSGLWAVLATYKEKTFEQIFMLQYLHDVDTEKPVSINIL